MNVIFITGSYLCKGRGCLVPLTCLPYLLDGRRIEAATGFLEQLSTINKTISCVGRCKRFETG